MLYDHDGNRPIHDATVPPLPGWQQAYEAESYCTPDRRHRYRARYRPAWLAGGHPRRARRWCGRASPSKAAMTSATHRDPRPSEAQGWPNEPRD